MSRKEASFSFPGAGRSSDKLVLVHGAAGVGAVLLHDVPEELVVIHGPVVVREKETFGGPADPSPDHVLEALPGVSLAELERLLLFLVAVVHVDDYGVWGWRRWRWGWRRWWRGRGLADLPFHRVLLPCESL